MLVNTLVKGKILVKALIDISSKFNTISKSLFDRLETDHRIRLTCDPIKNLYKDTIGQGWLWVHKAKIIFGVSSRAYKHHDKIRINHMSIPLIEDSNKASFSKNNSFDSSDSEIVTNSSNFNSHNRLQKKKYKETILTCTINNCSAEIEIIEKSSLMRAPSQKSISIDEGSQDLLIFGKNSLVNLDTIVKENSKSATSNLSSKHAGKPTDKISSKKQKQAKKELHILKDLIKELSTEPEALQDS
ncbi:33221_t:CDS:2, partial [Racocetra persica]